MSSKISCFITLFTTPTDFLAVKRWDAKDLTNRRSEINSWNKNKHRKTWIHQGTISVLFSLFSGKTWPSWKPFRLIQKFWPQQQKIWQLNLMKIRDHQQLQNVNISSYYGSTINIAIQRINHSPSHTWSSRWTQRTHATEPCVGHRCPSALVVKSSVQSLWSCYP